MAPGPGLSCPELPKSLSQYLENPLNLLYPGKHLFPLPNLDTSPSSCGNFPCTASPCQLVINPHLPLLYPELHSISRALTPIAIVLNKFFLAISTSVRIISPSQFQAAVLSNHHLILLMVWEADGRATCLWSTAGEMGLEGPPPRQLHTWRLQLPGPSLAPQQLSSGPLPALWASPAACQVVRPHTQSRHTLLPTEQAFLRALFRGSRRSCKMQPQTHQGQEGTCNLEVPGVTSAT